MNKLSFFDHACFEVQWTRGARVESRHLVHGVVVNFRGDLVASYGDLDLLVSPRSAFKPIQVLPLIFSRAHEQSIDPWKALIVAMASHKAQHRHLKFVQAWLSELGLSIEHLACGAHVPSDEKVFNEMILHHESPTALHNNCSGKHTGFLAVCQRNQWDLVGYEKYEHPLQKKIREYSSELSGLDFDRLDWGIDGCAVPTYFIPLVGFAKMMSHFLNEKDLLVGPASQLIREGLRREPEMLSGEGFFCSELAKVTKARVIGKVGAQGNYLCLDYRRGLVLAIKVQDGSDKAVFEAILALCQKHDILTRAEYEHMRLFAPKEVLNWSGAQVGESRVVFN